MARDEKRIGLECPGCGRALNIRKKYVGQRVECKHCSETFEVPDVVVLRCPLCDRKARVQASDWGGQARCGQCGEDFPIEGLATLPGAPGPPKRPILPEDEPTAPPVGPADTDAATFLARAERAEAELEALRVLLGRVQEKILDSGEPAGPAEGPAMAPGDVTNIGALVATPGEQAEGAAQPEATPLASELRGQLEEAEGRCRDLEATAARLRDEIEAEREARRAERDDLARRADEADRAMEASAQDVARLTAECDRLRSAHEAEAEARTKEVADLRAECDRLEAARASESAERRAEAEATSAALADLHAERDRLAAAHESEGAARRAEAEAASDAARVASELRERLDEAQGRCRDLEATAARLRDEIEADRGAHRAERDDLARRADEAGRAMEAAGADIARLRAECDRLAAAPEADTDAAARRGEAEARSREVAFLRAECSRLGAAYVSEVTARRVDAEAASDALARLASQRDAILLRERDLAERTKAEVAALQAEVAVLQAEVDRLRQALTQAQAQIAPPPAPETIAYKDIALEQWKPSIFRPAPRPSAPPNAGPPKR
jgi:DNA repair exonuclease SbcCD ATPase subunit